MRGRTAAAARSQVHIAQLWRHLGRALPHLLQRVCRVWQVRRAAKQQRESDEASAGVHSQQDKWRWRPTKALVEEAGAEGSRLRVGGSQPPRKGALHISPPPVDVVQYVLHSITVAH
jgi:hypothetical protein